MAMEQPPEEAPLAGEEAGAGLPGKDVNLTRIEVVNLVLIGLAAVGGLSVSTAFSVGVLTGGALMALNFRIIVAVMRAVFLRGSTSLVNVGGYWLKFVGVLVLVGVCILVFETDPIGFLVGLSAILVAITAEAVLRLASR